MRLQKPNQKPWVPLSKNKKHFKIFLAFSFANQFLSKQSLLIEQCYLPKYKIFLFYRQFQNNIFGEWDEWWMNKDMYFDL